MTTAEELTRIIGSKNSLKTSIENKGVTVPDDALIDSYYEYVDAIEQGGGGESYDFTEIGYSQDMSDGINNDTKNRIIDGIAYAKQIAETWNPNATTILDGKYKNDMDLVYLPNIDTSKAITVGGTSSTSGMFNSASNLEYIDRLDFPKVTSYTGGMFYRCSSLKKINALSFGNVTNAAYMFSECNNLVSVPLFDTSSCTNMNQMFYHTFKLEEIPLFDTSSCTNMNNMFAGGAIKRIHTLNTQNVTIVTSLFNNCKYLEEYGDFICPKITSTNAQYAFSGCSSLKRVGNIDLGNATNINYLFQNDTALESVGTITANGLTAAVAYFFSNTSDLNNFTDFGGIQGLKTNWNDGYGLVKCPNLTHQSLINVLNGLYDFTGAGQTPSSTQGKLKLGTANYNKLSAEDIAIGTNKGWQITA